MPTIRADATDDLFRAAKGGTVSEVRTALSAGADLGAHDEVGNTPLHMAAMENTSTVIVALTTVGADHGARNETDDTPLHRTAAENASPSVIKALIEGGAEPGARTESGEMPFDYAKNNKAVRGTNAYWRLNEARFE